MSSIKVALSGTESSGITPVIVDRRGLRLLPGGMSRPGRRAVRVRHFRAAPTGPVRVAFLTPQLMVGGVEMWLVALARFARRTRWTVAVESPERIVPLIADALAGRADVLTGPDAVRDALEWADVAVSWAEPDLEWALGNWPGLAVQVSHGEGRWTRGVCKAAMRRAAHAAAVSKCAAEGFESGVDVRIIYNGVDPQRCEVRIDRATMRAAWGIGAAEIVIGYVGRFSPEKSCTVASRAALYLGEPHRAVYVGQGPLAAHIRSIDPRARIVPPMYQVGDAYGAIDVLITGSDREGCSLVNLEAMLAGVPVVSTPVGIMPEMEGLYTRIEPGAGSADLAAAVRAAITDRSKIDRARAAVRERFLADRMAVEWEEYLVGIAHAHAAVARAEAPA